MTPRIDGYRLETVIGSGGQAQVWAARRIATGERVAIKWLPAATRRDEEAARIEAARLTSLEHPHLIQLVQYVVAEGGCALVMEYAAGGSLAALLRRRERLTPPEIVAALSPIASALAYAHAEGVQHCDVSAANILFAADGHPKLADLGIARLAAGQASVTEIVGTPAYLDPAVAAGSAPVTAGDVFSLGAVALHCLTGLGPWQRQRGDSVELVLQRAAAADMADLEAALAGAPPELSTTVRRALELQPYRRGTAAEFALDLRAAIAPRPVVVGAGRIAAGSAGGGRHAASDASFDGVAVDLTRVVRRRPPTITDTGHDRRCSKWRKLSRAGRRSGQPSAARLPVRWSSLRPRRGVMLATAGALAACGVAAAGFVLARSSASAGPRDDGAAAQGPVAPGTATGGTVAPGTATGGAEDPASVTAALAALRGLDAQRSAAYATRDPGRLAAVYDDPTLLKLDQARLRATVPIGCRLTGLSTVYNAPRTLGESPAGWQLSVTATVESAELDCPGRPPASLAPLPPTPLRITLKRGTEGYRIIAEQRLS